MKKSDKRQSFNVTKTTGLRITDQQMIKGGSGIPAPGKFKTPTWKYVSGTPLTVIAAATGGYVDGVWWGVGYEGEKID